MNQQIYWWLIIKYKILINLNVHEKKVKVNNTKMYFFCYQLYVYEYKNN